MKKIYYILIAIEAITILTTIVLPFISPIIFADYWQMLLCVILGIPLLTLTCMAVEYRNCTIINEDSSVDTDCAEVSYSETDEDKQQKAEKEESQETMPKETKATEENIKKKDSVAETEECMEKKWSQAMYHRYSGQWDELFNHIKRPMTPEVKSQISLLLWEIASQTVNFLKESNSDLNKVSHNTEGLRMILDNLSLNDMKLEEFYKDPTTVPVSVITVYEWLEEQGVKTETAAFGYKLKF